MHMMRYALGRTVAEKQLMVVAICEALKSEAAQRNEFMKDVQDGWEKLKADVHEPTFSAMHAKKRMPGVLLPSYVAGLGRLVVKPDGEYYTRSMCRGCACLAKERAS
jgi:hypothetical protein